MGAPQPGTPYAKIYFGDVLVASEKNKSLMNFNYERSTTSGSNKATFVLADPKWTEIEDALLDAGGEFTFEYGWVDGVDRWSPRYKLVVQKYVPKITNEHIEISVEGKTLGFVKKEDDIQNIVMGQTNKVLSYETTKALEEAYKARGFETEIDDVDYHEKTFCVIDATLPNYQPHLYQGVTDNQYVRHYITKYAATGDNKKHGGYYFYFDDEFTKSAKPKVYFKKSWINPNQIKYNLEVPDLKNYEVIGFEPEMNLMALRTGEGQQRKTLKLINNFTGEDFWVHREKEEWPSVTVTNPELFRYKFFESVKGENHTPQNHPYLTTGQTFEQSRQAITSLYEDRALQVNKATLSLVGDPKYRLLDVIGITVYKRGIGVDGSGVHYSSGSWLVVGITDDIQPGSYITTLQLKRLGIYTPATSVVRGVYE